MRLLVSHLQLLVAILVTMLAFGNGLPGIVHALGDAATHVCTCSNGGDHASCRVCNPKLTEHRSSSEPAVEGTPCGERRLASAPGCDVSVLPTPVAEVANSVVRVDAPQTRRLILEQALLEPATPPPRHART